jgi:hypothetical protein
MFDRFRLMTRYHGLRRVSRAVNEALVERLTKDIMDEGGKKLGILKRGMLVIESEEEMGVLMDFCIHDTRLNGRTVVQHFLDENPYRPGSQEATILEALESAVYSMFVVESRIPGIGANFRNTASGESVRIVDVGLGQCAEPGLLLATRIITVGDITMTTGASLPVAFLPEDDHSHQLIQKMGTQCAALDRMASPDERSETNAILIRALLKNGATSHIAHEDRFEEQSRGPHRRGQAVLAAPRPRYVPRNGPCPCGSGKKYKNCCDAGR